MTAAPCPGERYGSYRPRRCSNGRLIKKAYDRPFDPSFTDDATVAEAAGVTIHLTHGNRENIKITTPEDLLVAQALLQNA
ncbi:MAG: 2-C-methyl-D-erythritol 4-phosphate cytidylyltransferase [Marinilabiliales bacterium]|nr:2-C-methyl-D-erythritol 4-phosphate cytidylyltransferase [Marinilabiliales bacterium]